MTYNVKYGQNIFDVAIVAYQDASRAMDLIRENPQIESLISDLTGITVTYTPGFITQKKGIKKIVAPSQKNVTINSNQTLFDIALQYHGGADKILDVVIALGVDSMLSDPTGFNLSYTENKTAVPLYFRRIGGKIGTKFPISFNKGRFRITTNNLYRITTSGNFRIIN